MNTIQKQITLELSYKDTTNNITITYLVTLTPEVTLRR